MISGQGTSLWRAPELQKVQRHRGCQHYDIGTGNLPMEGTRITKGTEVQRYRGCPHHDSGTGNQPMEGTRITKGTEVQRYRGCPHYDSGPGNQPMEGTTITKGSCCIHATKGVKRGSIYSLFHNKYLGDNKDNVHMQSLSEDQQCL